MTPVLSPVEGPRLLPLSVLLAVLLAMLLTIVLVVACGGGDDGRSAAGPLTDPREVPTNTPWTSPPEVIIIDPNAIQPLPSSEPPPIEDGGGDDGGEDSGGEPGVCGETYEVVAGDTFVGIAEKCGVSQEDLETANPEIENIRELSIGDVLNIPAPSTEE